MGCGARSRIAPRFAVIYEDNFNYLSKMCLLRMRQAALTMIDAARERGITIVVAGADATDHPATYLDRGAAVVVAGEGEVTLVELLDALTGEAGQSSTRRSTASAAAMLRAASSARGRARSSATSSRCRCRPGISSTSTRYRSMWRARHGYFSMNVVTTRGCPYHCNWCAKPIYGQRYTARSPEHVVEEMAWLKRTFQPDHLWIADDIFGLKPGWIERFATLVEDARRGDSVQVPAARRSGDRRACRARCDAAGCRTAWIGAESGSQRILDAMEKGTRVDQIVDATRLLHGAGVDVGFFLQFGYPGETRRGHRPDAARWCATARPDDIGVSVSYPLPGTTFYQRVQAQLGQKQNWVDSNDLAMMYHATYVPDFYRALHALVHAEFRARRSAARIASRAQRSRGPPGRATRAPASDLPGTTASLLPTPASPVDRLSRVPTPLIPLLDAARGRCPTDQRRRDADVSSRDELVSLGTSALVTARRGDATARSCCRC